MNLNEAHEHHKRRVALSKYKDIAQSPFLTDWQICDECTMKVAKDLTRKFSAKIEIDLIQVAATGIIFLFLAWVI